MLLFTTPPLLLGFASGPAAYLLKLKGGDAVDFSPAALYTAGTVLFALAAVGISYGVLSTSWDPARKGSALGFDEFQRNVAVVKESIPFLRSKPPREL